MVVGVSAAYAERARDVYDSEALSGNVRDHPGQLVDRDHFLGTDIHRPGEFRVNQAADTLEAFIDIEERASLLAVAPDLDLAAVFGFRNLTAQRSRRLLSTARPRAIGTEDVVEAGDPHLDAIVPHVGEVKPLTEQFLPAILAVGRRRVGGILGTLWVQRVHLVVLRVHARGGGVEELPAFTPKCKQLRLMVAELCITSASCSPVKMYPAPPMSAASW